MSPPKFAVAARAALADTQLRRNLAAATGDQRARRAAAVGELPDWPLLRAAGRAAKDQALLGLDAAVEELEQTVAEAGGTVHWARDAAEACAIVTELVDKTGETEVVKATSALTREIGLAEALAAAGITAHETALADLVAQLGGDGAPALQKNRAQIRELFRARLPGVPQGLTDDPEELAAAARAYLRDRFRTTKVGVCGANFAVAETGTLVLLESEGNGRMCLTLPETLISVVGIEKVVPAWRDLEVFLQLLPRSAAGDRMTPATSMWTGVTPGDGPREVHLVLLDNGRTTALADRIGRAALRCIRCSACLHVCPVYERTGGQAYGSAYPGPIGAALTPQLRGVERPLEASLPYASTLCGACADVCPVEIDIPGILVHLRPGGGVAAPPPGADPGDADDAQPRLDHGRPRPLRVGPGTDRPVGPPAVPRRPDPPAARPARPVDRDARRPGPAPPELPHLVADAMTAREEILGRVRAALAGAEKAAPVPRDYAIRLEAGRADVVALFTERVADNRATVRHAAADELGTAVAAALWGREARRIVVPADLPYGWLAELDGVQAVPDSAALDMPALDAMDGVVTGCALAIAQTGTLVLDGGRAQGRRLLSLVPDHLLCIVHVDQIVGTVPEAIGRLDPYRPLTWISGPSATGDLGPARVEGMHGPRSLDVLVVED